MMQASCIGGRYKGKRCVVHHCRDLHHISGVGSSAQSAVPGR